MFGKYIAKIFALEPAATAVECGVISAILLTAFVCLMLAVGDPFAGLYSAVLSDAVVSAR